MKDNLNSSDLYPMHLLRPYYPKLLILQPGYMYSANTVIEWKYRDVFQWISLSKIRPVASQRRLWGVRGNLNVKVFLIKIPKILSRIMFELPDPFRRMGVWWNFTEAQQSGHALRSGPEVNNRRSRAKDGAPERLRCGAIQNEVS